jgi:hypothetical protein
MENIKFYILLMVCFFPSMVKCQILVSVHYERKNVIGSDIELSYYIDTLDSLLVRFNSKMKLCEESFLQNFGTPLVCNGFSNSPCIEKDTTFNIIDSIFNKDDAIKINFLENKLYKIYIKIIKVNADICCFPLQNRFWGYPVRFINAAVLLNLKKIIKFNTEEIDKIGNLKLRFIKCDEHYLKRHKN